LDRSLKPEVVGSMPTMPEAVAEKLELDFDPVGEA
jgi:hypothetical protein